MQKIPNTFCPAKWDELYVNLGVNYAYACCKSTPVKFVKDPHSALDSQKENLLTGIQDPACSYCWKVEKAGGVSLRQDYLKTFVGDVDDYQSNQIQPKMVEVSLGNECNFQCTYCNPKFSSQWESDVANQPYKLFTDKYFYAVEDKNSNTVTNSIEWLQSLNQIQELAVIGGEPLLNKNFYKIVGEVQSDILSLTTNLSCPTTAINKLFALAPRYKQIILKISIDATDEIAEFTRFGMNYQTFLNNMNHVLTRAPANVTILVASLMTSLTIRDLANFANLVESWHKTNSTITWALNTCQYPITQSMNTLPDELKSDILLLLSEIKQREYVIYADILESNVLASKFNNTQYQELQHFLNEFSQRKNTVKPTCLN